MISINSLLSLTPLTGIDAADVLHLTSENRELLRRFLPWVDDVQDLSGARAYIRNRAYSGLPGATWWKVHYGEEFAGIFAIKQVDDESVAELGYWLGQAFHGNGIITSLIQWIVTDYAKEHNIRQLSWHILADNLASRRNAERAGAKFVGSLRQLQLAVGKPQALNEYRLKID